MFGGNNLLLFHIASGSSGALLVADSANLLYYQVNEVTLAESEPVIANKKTLYKFSSTVRGKCFGIRFNVETECFSIIIGISYHLHRPNMENGSEIYVSLDSGEIRKLKVVVRIGIDNIELTPVNKDSIVYTTGGKPQLGRVSVDWINDLIYWVEKGDGNCTIHRLSLNGGESEQVGVAQMGEITDIFLDPLYG